MSDDLGVWRIAPGDRTEGAPTKGMVRRQAVGTPGMWAGIVLTDAGMVSGWHHHGDYETSIYVMSGTMRMEFGPGGAQTIDAQPGDFIYIAPHVIHREGNPSKGQGTAVVFRAGHGEPVTNVDGPAPA
jgi:uncharacterized RmlC-like cupin family protein